VNGDVLRPGCGGAGEGDVFIAVVGDGHVANAHGHTRGCWATPGVVDGDVFVGIVVSKCGCGDQGAAGDQGAGGQFFEWVHGVSAFSMVVLVGMVVGAVAFRFQETCAARARIQLLDIGWRTGSIQLYQADTGVVP